MTPSRQAIEIAKEHVVWARAAGFTNTEIAASIGHELYLWPNQDDLIHRFAITWMKMNNTAFREAA